MKHFVLDCSVTMGWVLEDEKTDYTEAVLDSLTENRAIVPSLWELEVSNVLIIAERRGRIAQAQTTYALSLLSSLPILVDPLVPKRILATIPTLAREHQLSAYDAAYLELALREGVAIATLDRKLEQIAMKCGVEIYKKS
ncbi:MAG: type II toxin-antitoxin system VapC family toxin [Acaryochloridaceae cyanobacterium RU_4_10]|nr:type II toxin-antitoxin system VapC family toxin [Acaryochloridaceae cyanobacterium RU_4_10]